MQNLKSWLLMMLCFGFATIAMGHIDPTKAGPAKNRPVKFREDCVNATAQIDMRINNVRARLLTGGDVWWDGSGDGQYVVPNTPPEIPAKSSIFAGAVWLGGVDPSQSLKIAAQLYGTSSGQSDFYPGPLDPVSGRTDQETCSKWDRFFVVDAEQIDLHLANYFAAVEANQPYNPDDIPNQVKAWPARGNEFFAESVGFDLPNTNQGLAGFFDRDGNGLYDPTDGDYPIIEIRGCEEPQYPDQMTFWIYNDAGNVHEQTGSETPIQMEVQVQAFAYRTNDEVNNMTFQRYKLINRAVESIDSTFFAMWVDPDLGCYVDDYIGCDVERSLAYVYNVDALDGQDGSCDCSGVNTYCDEVPILGVDYFRGPLDELGNEIGMSSFTYFNNAGVPPTPPPGTTDPQVTAEYYNYLSGTWRDGTPFTFGGDAYQDSQEPIKYAFVDPPNDNSEDAWSMCSESLPSGDRRTVQASGPFRLDPGAVNELIVGVVWVPDQIYPCPSISKLQQADDIAQNLFDNCFKLTRGPDAPDVDFVELDEEIIAILSNEKDPQKIKTNNPFESYEERGLTISPGVEDSTYVFEGYKIFQLSGPTVSLQSDREDPSKVRLVAQVDLKNGVGKLFNWIGLDSEVNPLEEEFFVPELQVDGADSGIRHTFRITEDQFAEGNRRLINHKKYYFTAVAYAYNEFEAFDPETGLGQREPYLEGDRNIGDGENDFYTVIPRPITDRQLKSEYGASVQITRLDGAGNGGKFLNITDDTRAAIEEGIKANDLSAFNGEVTYTEGQGPFEVSVFNPLDVKDGEYELRFIDSDLGDDVVEPDTRWELVNLSDPGAPVIASERTISELNEQIIKEFGFSVTIEQVTESGATPFDGNGYIGVEYDYAQNGATSEWLNGLSDNLRGSPLDAGVIANLGTLFDYISTELGAEDESLDPSQSFSSDGQFFTPYFLNDYRTRPADVAPSGYITPALTDATVGNVARGQTGLEQLNNVDIVFTSNKDLWSRCVIVESAGKSYSDQGFTFTEGQAGHFDLRQSPSVGKEADPNTGLPVEDGDGVGMGWFPGYAIDVETGQRLNIFFGENSLFHDDLDNPDFDPVFFLENYLEKPNGRDMMFNPSSQFFLPPERPTDPFSLLNMFAGGQHFIYVTNTPYDECADLREKFDGPFALFKLQGVNKITWAGFPLLNEGTSMNSYAEGLIPEDLTVKLRVNNPFQVELDNEANEFEDRTGSADNSYHPLYRFTLEGFEAQENNVVEVENQLDMINVVPNPYFGFSDYEPDKFTNIVKITNLPPQATVTIYSLDGKFIRQYIRNETPSIPDGNNRALSQNQITPALEWDLKNSKGIPIASGVYLIHVEAPGLGNRTLKWFGVNRKFDASGL